MWLNPNIFSFIIPSIPLSLDSFLMIPEFLIKLHYPIDCYSFRIERYKLYGVAIYSFYNLRLLTQLYSTMTTTCHLLPSQSIFIKNRILKRNTSHREWMTNLNYILSIFIFLIVPSIFFITAIEALISFSDKLGRPSCPCEDW